MEYVSILFYIIEESNVSFSSVVIIAKAESLH